MSLNAHTKQAGWLRFLLPIALAASAGAQDPVFSPAASQVEQVVHAAAPALQSQDGSVFGDPLIVNGNRISDTSIKRFLCYGKGRNGLESLRLGLLMDQERELRRLKATERLLEENYGGKTLEELSDVQASELKRAVEAEMSRFILDPREYEQRLQSEKDSFQERYPSLDLETEIKRAYQSMDWWEDQIRMTLEFDQLFFPGHPDGWPQLSLEAVHQVSPNADLVADYRKWYEVREQEWKDNRKTAKDAALAETFDGASEDGLTDEQRARLTAIMDEEAGAFMRREEDMMMMLLRDAVQAILGDMVLIKTASDGLPDELLMSIEGNGLEANLTTEQVYQDMKAAFDEEDIYEAKLFLSLMEAAKGKLAASEVLKPEGPFREELAAQKLASENAGTFGSFGFVAMSAYRFPSVESYEDYTYLYNSFRESIDEELQLDENGNLPPELQAHLPVVQGIMGIAKVQAENLLVSAFDYPNNKWFEGGWEKAGERAMTLRAEVDAYVDKVATQDAARAAAAEKGETYEPEVALQPFDEWWTNFIDLHSDFWDPPLPVTGKAPPANSLRDKGRFDGTPTTRNDLKGALGESPYTHFLWNSNAVDAIFFDVPQGSVGGPFRAPKGYLISYVKRKLPASKSISIRDEANLKALQEDFAQLSFTRFCHEALNEAQVTGL